MQGETMILYLTSRKGGDCRGFLRVEEQDRERLLDFFLMESADGKEGRYQVWLKGKGEEETRFIGELLVDCRGRARGRWRVPSATAWIGQRVLLIPPPGQGGDPLAGRFPLSFGNSW